MQLGDAADAVFRELRFEGLADAPDQRHGLRREKAGRFFLADDGKAARLVDFRRQLGCIVTFNGQRVRVGETLDLRTGASTDILPAGALAKEARE